MLYRLEQLSPFMVSMTTMATVFCEKIGIFMPMLYGWPGKVDMNAVLGDIGSQRWPAITVFVFHIPLHSLSFLVWLHFWWEFRVLHVGLFHMKPMLIRVDWVDVIGEKASRMWAMQEKYIIYSFHNIWTVSAGCETWHWHEAQVMWETTQQVAIVLAS